MLFIDALFCLEFSLKKSDCVIKTREIFSSLPLINNSVTIALKFLLLSISTTYRQIQYFHKYHPHHLSNE